VPFQPTTRGKASAQQTAATQRGANS
jgi:hypothetical protein